MSKLEIMGACVEDVRFHRLTDVNSTVTVTKVFRISNSEFGEIVRNVTLPAKREPLLTRVQPPICDKPACDIDSFTSTDRFSGYEFLDTYPTAVALDPEQRQRKICFVGQSHSREIIVHLTNSGVFFGVAVQIEAKFPADFNTAVIEQVRVEACTVIVLGIGQWPAGYPGGEPFGFDEYAEEMFVSLTNFRVQLKELYGTHRPHIFVRSVHENPLGNQISKCPPTDWRNPEVIRIYNEILEGVCSRVGLHFIDTNEIIQPLWDSAEDWCHYTGFVGKADALAIARVVYTHISRAKT